MSQNVKFYFGRQEKYDALLEKDSLALYFIEDTKRLYKGDVLIATGAEATVLSAGLMSPEDKIKLITLDEEIATKANVSDVEALELEIATKVTAEEVDAKVASANDYTNKMIEAAMDEHLTKKYEVADVPVGTLINYRENEIRIMVPSNTEWVKQNVGTGGDANTNYFTFKTYAPEGAVGYKEHLGNQVDSEILTDLKADEYGRKYQPTWLGLARCDESGVWTYYGANSKENHYIGWDYRIDWFNAENVMIGSDCIRINLSNENCHSTVEPYYVSEVKTEVEAMIEEKVAEVNSAYEIVEF